LRELSRRSGQRWTGLLLLGGNLKFTITHTRVIEGNDIYVSVQADDGKSIGSVRTQLDGFDLADDQLSAPSDFYEHSFSRAGTAGPHTQHTLIVTAELADGAAHSSTSIWSDPI
jgi:hypothetical protein